ncbi:S-adenosyl-L-methionine dependent methyltransferase [Trametes coccinea BRFM310]|uniref:S-adenosyl-L-methionine dependent methyltransferase n=1 Tax=Trametes coccinea (strain BRFM310) TaxID=1353009 RepID=A0A1Y2IG77_TRAC3|nr:S-adenosyl-L-methionine dependent methyltransferase [Trametes coccinea BRFM310]
MPTTLAPSASVYTQLALRFYDFVVLTVSNYWAWRCPTGSVLLPFYQQHIGDSAHLEIGAGTGYYPAASCARLAKGVKLVTLLDLNPNTLAYARARLANAGFRGDIEAVQHDVFDVLPETMRARYDSVALVYLFHCLPGTFPKKATDVFRNVVPALAEGGIVYGATILGWSAQHNWLGTRLMNLYNGKGIFGNAQDTVEGLRAALDETFEECEVRVVGVVALFTARRPKAT